MTAVQNVLAQVDWNTVMVICLVAIATLIVGKTLASLIGRQVASSMDKTSALITEKLVFYGVAVFGFAVILNVLEVGFTTLLAAGGVLGIALGFASQTAFSNIISGIFLIFERPFNVGDVIRIDDRFGAVESIDLLSTKIRMFDNLFWRIPNEKLIKSDIITITKYDIRRMDVATSITYDDDIERARDVLIKTAEANPMVMGDPEPITIVNSMGESGIELTLRCWFHKNDYITLLADLTQEVKQNLETAGCTIPYPHRTVYVREEESWQQAQVQDAKSSPTPDKSPDQSLSN